MLVLPASLTHQEARDTLGMLSQALEREPEGATVLLDASPLQQFDSSALAVFLECQRQARASGRRCVLKHPPDALVALAKLYGVDALLPTGDVPIIVEG
ncbi:MAG: lipid asymmetry maintenance protein MlaB [Burkholderiales bacterium]|jgi:phospholipid transport system transporter-binding protein